MGMTEEEVKRRTVLYEMEDELWRLVKRRAWMFALVAAAVGMGGVWAIVHFTIQQVADRPLKDLQKQLILAEAQADGAKAAATASRASADQAAASLLVLQTSIQGLQEEAKGVADRFSLVSQQINAASANSARRSQQDFNALQQRIAGLETLVKKIGDENDATRKATADYARQVATLEARVEREQKRFAENSEYTVSIFFDPSRKVQAAELQSRLAALGFRSPIRELPAKTAKGNTLTYQSPSDAKAQEVMALVKPVVKDVQAKKIPELGLSSLEGFSKKSEGLKIESHKYESLPGGLVMLMFWGMDPKSMSLTLGVTP